MITSRVHNKRISLIQQLQNWKSGKEAPVDEDGNAEPLKVLVLRMHNDPNNTSIANWKCDAKMDHVERADEILKRCHEYANELAVSGEAIVFVLYPLFGSDMVGGRTSFPIQIVPEPKFSGTDQFVGAMATDYRDPRNRDATQFRENTSLVREAWGLVGGTMRVTIGSLEQQLERAQNRIRELEADRERTWAIQQKLMDHQLDRELKYRKENVQLAMMEAAGAKVLSYIPVLMKSVDEWVFKKSGGKVATDDETNEYRETVQMILSKFGDKEKARRVFEVLGLDEVEMMKIVNMGKKLSVEEQRMKLQEEAKASIQGLPSVVPIRRLPGGE